MLNQGGPSYVIGPFAEYILVLHQQAAQLFLLVKVGTISFGLYIQIDQMRWQVGLVLFWGSVQWLCFTDVPFSYGSIYSNNGAGLYPKGLVGRVETAYHNFALGIGLIHTGR